MKKSIGKILLTILIASIFVCTFNIVVLAKDDLRNVLGSTSTSIDAGGTSISITDLDSYKIVSGIQPNSTKLLFRDETYLDLVTSGDDFTSHADYEVYEVTFEKDSDNQIGFSSINKLEGNGYAAINANSYDRIKVDDDNKLIIKVTGFSKNDVTSNGTIEEKENELNGYYISLGQTSYYETFLGEYFPLIITYDTEGNCHTYKADEDMCSHIITHHETETPYANSMYLWLTFEGNMIENIVIIDQDLTSGDVVEKTSSVYNSKYDVKIISGDYFISGDSIVKDGTALAFDNTLKMNDDTWIYARGLTSAVCKQDYSSRNGEELPNKTAIVYDNSTGEIKYLLKSQEIVNKSSLIGLATKPTGLQIAGTINICLNDSEKQYLLTSGLSANVDFEYGDYIYLTFGLLGCNNVTYVSRVFNLDDIADYEVVSGIQPNSTKVLFRDENYLDLDTTSDDYIKHENYNVFEVAYSLDDANKISISSVTQKGKGYAGITFESYDRVKVDEDAKVIIVVKGFTKNQVIENGVSTEKENELNGYYVTLGKSVGDAALLGKTYSYITVFNAAAERLGYKIDDSLCADMPIHHGETLNRYAGSEYVWLTFEGTIIDNAVMINKDLNPNDVIEATGATYDAQYSVRIISGDYFISGECIVKDGVAFSANNTLRMDDDTYIYAIGLNSFSVKQNYSSRNGQELPAGTALVYDSSNGKIKYVFESKETLVNSTLLGLASSPSSGIQFVGQTRISMYGETHTLSGNYTSYYDKYIYLVFTSIGGESFIKIKGVFDFSNFSDYLNVSEVNSSNIKFTNGSSISLDSSNTDYIKRQNYNVFEVSYTVSGDNKVAVSNITKCETQGYSGINVSENDRVKIDDELKAIVVIKGFNSTETIVDEKFVENVGDYNDDTLADSRDLTYFAKYVAKIIEIDDEFKIKVMDVTRNGSTDSNDLTKFAKYVARIINTLN